MPGAALLDRLYNARPSGEPIPDDVPKPPPAFKPVNVGGSLKPVVRRAAAPATTASPVAHAPDKRPAPATVQPKAHPPAPAPATATATATLSGIARPVIPPITPPAPAPASLSPVPPFPGPIAAVASPARAVAPGAVPTIPVPSPTKPLRAPVVPVAPTYSLAPRMFTPGSPASIAAAAAAAATAVAPAPISAQFGSPMAMAGTQYVQPTAPRPKPEALGTPLSATVIQQQAADPAQVDAIRSYFARALPVLQKHAAGTPNETHVAETISKLEPLAQLLVKLPDALVQLISRMCQELERKEWPAAEASLASITKDHGKELPTQVLVGIRFLVRLSKLVTPVD